MERLRENISPSLILSVIAVFIALGGGAYAAVQANSVGSKQLKNNAVVAKKIKNNAVTAAKIKANAIVAAKIKAGAVDASKIKADAVETSKIKNGAVTEDKLDPAVTGKAVAYASIKPDGTVDAAKSRGITNANVVTYGTAIYCFKDLPDFGTMVVTPGMGLTEFDGIVSANAQQAPFDEGICSPFPTAQAGVITYYDDFFGAINPVQSKKPFSIVLFK